MRKELIEILNFKGCASEYDFHRTLHLARHLHTGRLDLVSKHQREAEKENLPEAQFMAYADDIAWYAYEESFFIWHFCLWRVQAIFESIITTKFLSTERAKKLVGFKAKLNALRRAGYTMEDSEYADLLKWAEIRNRLSHFPPSSHAPGPLQESDIVEYLELCSRLCRNWGKLHTGAT
jgi:hypothetical protein